MLLPVAEASDNSKNPCSSPVKIITSAEGGMALTNNKELANKMKISFMPIRKKGKLPGETISRNFKLEYGSAEIEITNKSLKNKKILIIDDLLATGGTVEAAIKLIESLDGTIISLGFLIELKFLKARDTLTNYNIFSIVSYD